MAREKKQGGDPRLARKGAARGASAAGSGRARPEESATPSGEAEESREAVRHSRPSRSSAASGRVSGALRDDASVRGGRDESGEPLEAGPSPTAAHGTAVRSGSRERDRGDEPEHTASGTAIAAEAIRSGVVPNAVPRNPDDDAIPGESEVMKAGDPDDETLRNTYVGEETPGGSTPTPDQGNVDDIGRAFGVQEEDSGELRTSTEILEARDERRRSGYLGKRKLS